jgi:hypothetical protein
MTDQVVRGEKWCRRGERVVRHPFQVVRGEKWCRRGEIGVRHHSLPPKGGEVSVAHHLSRAHHTGRSSPLEWDSTMSTP